MALLTPDQIMLQPFFVPAYNAVAEYNARAFGYGSRFAAPQMMGLVDSSWLRSFYYKVRGYLNLQRENSTSVRDNFSPYSPGGFDSPDCIVPEDDAEFFEAVGASALYNFDWNLAAGWDAWVLSEIFRVLGLCRYKVEKSASMWSARVRVYVQPRETATRAEIMEAVDIAWQARSDYDAGRFVVHWQDYGTSQSCRYLPIPETVEYTGNDREICVLPTWLVSERPGKAYWGYGACPGTVPAYTEIRKYSQDYPLDYSVLSNAFGGFTAMVDLDSETAGVPDATDRRYSRKIATGVPSDYYGTNFQITRIALKEDISSRIVAAGGTVPDDDVEGGSDG